LKEEATGTKGHFPPQILYWCKKATNFLMLELLSEQTYMFLKLTVSKIGLRMSKPESSPYMTMLVSCLVACRIIPVYKMENHVYQFRVSQAELH
jgi:hypothetical protein